MITSPHMAADGLRHFIVPRAAWPTWATTRIETPSLLVVMVTALFCRHNRGADANDAPPDNGNAPTVKCCSPVARFCREIANTRRFAPVRRHVSCPGEGTTALLSNGEPLRAWRSPHCLLLIWRRSLARHVSSHCAERENIDCRRASCTVTCVLTTARKFMTPSMPDCSRPGGQSPTAVLPSER